MGYNPRADPGYELYDDPLVIYKALSSILATHIKLCLIPSKFMTWHIHHGFLVKMLRTLEGLIFIF